MTYFQAKAKLASEVFKVCQIRSKDPVERLVLQIIYVLKKEILQFLGLKSTVYNRELYQSRAGYNVARTVGSIMNQIESS
jgi:hypothetical protein